MHTLESLLILSRTKLEFYPHIQGLRALAVTIVLLFHFELLGANAGFIGVDVFFVISGYLITAMLTNRAEQPMLPMLAKFYSQRLLRIVPAYLVTLLVVLLAGWFFLLPMDYQRLGRSTTAASVFASNHFFLLEAGYFDSSVVFKPLLHTWSLAVEMQFYLLWPIGYFVVRFLSDRNQAFVLVAVICIFFGATLQLSNSDASFAFYSLPTRLWEFGVGALIANPWARKRLSERLCGKPWMSWFALFALVASAFLMNEHLLWPAPWAVIPVIATAMLILEGIAAPQNQNSVMRFLSTQPMVWLGAISYSLYLVHWPVVSFISTVWWPEPSVTIRATAMFLCIPVSWVLYRYVERAALANGRILSSRAVIFLVFVSTLSAGVGLSRTDGFVSRYPAALREMLLGNYFMASKPSSSGECADTVANCSRPPTHKIFIWGDSHAGQFIPAMEELAAKSQTELLTSSKGGCPPFHNAARSSRWFGLKTNCLESNRRAFQKVMNDEKIQTVILAARWAYYFEGSTFGSEKGAPTYVVRSNSDPLSVEFSGELIIQQLETALAAFNKAGKRVIILHQVPELMNDGQRCFVMAQIRGLNPDLCSIDRDVVEQRQETYREAMSKILSKSKNASSLDFTGQLCNDGRCQATIDGQLAYRDNNHLLHRAALKLIEKHRKEIFGN